MCRLFRQSPGSVSVDNVGLPNFSDNGFTFKGVVVYNLHRYHPDKNVQNDPGI